MFPMWLFTAAGAFFLASVAAYFSITGLGALYSAAFIAIIIMGSAIEYGKLAATFWLHRNYKRASKLLVALITAVVIGSMAITSGGVYGFLTKGHLDQEIPLGDSKLRIERIDNRIDSNRALINREETRLKQLDSVIQTLIDYDKISGRDGARAVRERQASERKEIQESIDSAYEKIDELRDKRLTLSQKVSSVEAKLGPVKFLAELFGLDSDNTVRYFTLLIVLLLDPFAIMLVLATGISYDRWKAARGKKPIEPQIIEKEVPVEVEKIVEVPVEKIVEKVVEVPVEKIIEREVEIEKEAPLTMESIKEFLETPKIQDELIKHPELIEEVEKIVDTLNEKTKVKPKKPKKRPTSGWIGSDSGV